MTLDLMAFAMGLALGLPISGLFFWGLAWGMNKALASQRPAQWLLLSFMLRSGFLVAVAVVLIRWLEPFSALLGLMLAFMLVRMASVRWVKRRAD